MVQFPFKISHQIQLIPCAVFRKNDRNMKRVHVIITGKVQGVCFRAYTQDMAQVLNLTGWVRNLHGGGVEAVFEGKEEDIEKMIAWCRRGPRLANVENVVVKEEPHSGEFDQFSVRYSFK
jgi:acylphosphatase